MTDDVGKNAPTIFKDVTQLTPFVLEKEKKCIFASLLNMMMHKQP